MQRLVTGIETRIASFATLVFSIRFKKSLVSLRYDFFILTMAKVGDQQMMRFVQWGLRSLI